MLAATDRAPQAHTDPLTAHRGSVRGDAASHGKQQRLLALTLPQSRVGLACEVGSIDVGHESLGAQSVLGVTLP